MNICWYYMELIHKNFICDKYKIFHIKYSRPEDKACSNIGIEEGVFVNWMSFGVLSNQSGIL